MRRIAIVALLACAAPALAQSSFKPEPLGPFADAARSPVRYTETPVRAKAACADLTSLSGGELKVVSAEVVPASATAPEHCRVSAEVAPALTLQINLPVAWNQRFYMFGNGGAAGERPEDGNRPATRDRALRQGFVVASTNAGHDGKTEPGFNFGTDPRKVIDYGYRAVHITAETAKRAAQAYFSEPVKYSYWDACSTGGREGLMEAQRFPGDFDGLVVGAPALDFADLLLHHIWFSRTLEETPLSAAKVHLVGDKLYAKCDDRDGLKDGLIEDPRVCQFDVARDVPTCKAGEVSDACLTPAEAAAFKKMYDGPSTKGRLISHGRPMGAEPAIPGGPQSGWRFTPEGYVVTSGDAANNQLRNLVMNDQSYDYHSFDFDRDIPKMAALRAAVDAVDPNLASLRKRGGKVLMYIGWADMNLNPGKGVDYYEEATKVNGPGTADFFRLFMVPGMAHCGGGLGPDKFDAVTAMINWVERGTAPQTLIASQVKGPEVVRSRTLCPYPQTARYTGGPVDQASSFQCRAPARTGRGA